MYYKIKEVSVLDDYCLRVTYTYYNIAKYYDMKPLFEKNPEFAVLKDMEKLSNFQIDENGEEIRWNENLSLSREELWENGEMKIFKLDGSSLEESIALLKEILGLRPDQSFEDLPDIPEDDEFYD